MTFDDLIPLDVFSKNNDLTVRETLAKAFSDKVELFYIFDHRALVIYEPINSSFKGKGTKENIIGDPDCIEIEYRSCDVVPITKNIVAELWGHGEEKLASLIYDLAPDGFSLQKMLDGSERLIKEDNVFIYQNALAESYNSTSKSENVPVSERPTNTALKVIGFLMHHLAKSPKYSSGNKPNKSQIKELLLELSDELDVDSYGLSKVDERLLSDAMTYLDNQKN